MRRALCWCVGVSVCDNMLWVLSCSASDFRCSCADDWLKFDDDEVSKCTTEDIKSGALAVRCLRSYHVVPLTVFSMFVLFSRVCSFRSFVLFLFCSSMLVKVLMLSPAASSKGWLVELIQRTMTFPLAPVRLMLLASTTLLLRPSILARHGCITLDSRKVQTPSVVGWQSF